MKHVVVNPDVSHVKHFKKNLGIISFSHMCRSNKSLQDQNDIMTRAYMTTFHQIHNKIQQ